MAEIPALDLTPAHPAESPSAVIPTSAVVATVLGNALEFYDFTTYAFFAVMIGHAFFPAQDPFVSLLLSVAAFGVGFITRPLGGIVIGAYADRAGRKPAMMLSIGLMAVGMVMLAATPSYAAIGLAAPLLVILARLLQGFALGGEVGPSTSYLLEAAPAGKRGQYGAWQIASQGAASALAGLLGVLLSFLLDDAAMQSWGWRIPFIVGVAIVPVGLIMRSRLQETVDLGARTTHSSARHVLSALLKYHLRPLVLALMLITSGTIATYIGVYMTTYALSTLHMATGASMGATVVVGLCLLVFGSIGGWLSDRVGRKPVYLVSKLALTAVAYPAFVAINRHHTLAALLLMAGLMSALNALGGVVLVVIPELFPKSVRSAGLSTVYAVAVTVFGGTTQVVVAWLIHVTGDPLSPAWYLISTSAIGIVAILMVAETRDVALAD
ncbi:MAG TPA: MFS transporter [Candidatus Binataceae bacterium]|nr:MFS transporter [Candidatus Binataceae bacterium]HVB81010.1 MFS transporter [Candidatus Binataceae bacterium]